MMAYRKTRKFAVLDRDGTIIELHPYLSRPDQVSLLPGTGQALRELRALGLGLVVVTNQSGIGRGYFGLEDLASVHVALGCLLRKEGVELDGVYFCPHTPDDDCNCRKPRCGLLDRAAREHGFEIAESFVIGDNVCDIELGAAAGATTFLVRTGYGEQVEKFGGPSPSHVVDDLRGVVPLINGLS
jgi:D-glycero-D-manno-heptose 1,7-bisphosphate phosphatase